jgi:hypothetical protein
MLAVASVSGAVYGAVQKVSIISQALHDTGSPASSTLVTLYRDGLAIGVCVTDAAGVYKFSDLIESDYKVKISFKGGVDPLWVDYTSSRGFALTAFSSSVATGATFTVSAGTVSLSSPGSSYSFYVPPTITTTDGFVGKGLVSFDTGALTGVTTLAAGTGSSTSASSYTWPVDPSSSIKPKSFTNSITYGSSTGALNGSTLGTALTNTTNTFNDLSWVIQARIYARIGGAPPPWSYPAGVSIGVNAWLKMYDLLFNNGPGYIIYNGSGYFKKCIAWYAENTITIYGNSPDSTNVLLSADGFQQISAQVGPAQEGIAVYRIWRCELIDRTTACREIPSNPPGSMVFNEYPLVDLGCGGQYNSYAEFAAVRAAAAARQTEYDKKSKGGLPLKSGLPGAVDTFLNNLGLGDSAGLKDFIRYLNNYSTYSALENVADARATAQIAAARAAYGENSKEFIAARASAFAELNAAKGYLANEFAAKHYLNLLTGALDNGSIPGTSITLGVIDYLRGTPGGTTRADVISAISPVITTAFNTAYQVAESPALCAALGVGLLATGVGTAYGAGLLLTAAWNGGSGGGNSPSKAVTDLITQTSGTFTQPSWLNGQSYDTFDVRGLTSSADPGLRVTFSGGTYATAPITAPADALRPYTWDTNTKTYVSN